MFVYNANFLWPIVDLSLKLRRPLLVEEMMKGKHLE
jgi:hypothetical protein